MPIDNRLSVPLRSSSWWPNLRFTPVTVAVLFSVLASVLFSVLLVQTDGNLFIGVAVLGILATVAATFYRVQLGFYVFVFYVFLFDQWVLPNLESVTSQVGYFLNLNVIRWLPKFDQGVVTPMELQLALILFAWILTAAISKSLYIAPVPLKLVTIVFAAMLVGGIVYGQSRGGDFVIALWETRALFYLVIMFFLVPHIIHTREHLQTLIWVCIAGITVKALQGVLRFAENGFSFGWWPQIYETFTNHEDPVFMITLFILLIALSLFRAYPTQRRVLLWLLVPLLLGFVAAQRRATYASFLASLIVLVALLPKKERRRMLVVSSIVGVVFGLYLAMFWNASGRLASVAQQFKATVTDEGGVRGGKDVESTLYREAENYNLGFTYRIEPLMGVGLGRPFEQPARMWGVQRFPLGKYIAHNQILWIFVKTGLVGGFIFWFFFNCYIFHATVIYRRLKDPYFKAVCLISIVQVVNQFVVSYVDMQLTYYRNMTYLGILMGIVGVLDSLDKAEQKNGKSPEKVTKR